MCRWTEGMHASGRKGRNAGRWGDEWVAGKMGCPASEDQDHCWRETQLLPASFTFRSHCSNSSRTRGRRPRKTRESPKEVPLPNLHSSCLFSISVGTPRLKSN